MKNEQKIEKKVEILTQIINKILIKKTVNYYDRTVDIIDFNSTIYWDKDIENLLKELNEE